MLDSSCARLFPRFAELRGRGERRRRSEGSLPSRLEPGRGLRRHRRGRRPDPPEGRGLAPRLPRASRTREQRGPHWEDRGRRTALAGIRGEDRRREDRCRRPAPRRSPRSRGRAAIGHGRTSGRGGSRPPLQVERHHAMGGPADRRDARVRPRQPSRHPPGNRPRSGWTQGPARGQRQVHLSARRGRTAPGRRGRRRADGEGGRAQRSEGRRDLRTSRLPV